MAVPRDYSNAQASCCLAAATAALQPADGRALQSRPSRSLFGPSPMLPSVRPRVGDFVAIAVGKETLVTSKEKTVSMHAISSQSLITHRPYISPVTPKE